MEPDFSYVPLGRGTVASILTWLKTTNLIKKGNIPHISENSFLQCCKEILFPTSSHDFFSLKGTIQSAGEKKLLLKDMDFSYVPLGRGTVASILTWVKTTTLIKKGNITHISENSIIQCCKEVCSQLRVMIFLV